MEVSSKPEFSRYISEINSQMINNKPPKPNKDEERTLKLVNLNKSSSRSPVFHNIEEQSRGLSHSISTLSNKRRSKSKITKIESIKKFKEDEYGENKDPNHSNDIRITNILQRSEASDRNHSRNVNQKNQYDISGRKIEFKTIDSAYIQTSSLQNHDRNIEKESEEILSKDYTFFGLYNIGNHVSPKEGNCGEKSNDKNILLMNKQDDYKNEETESLKSDAQLPSNEPLISHIEQIERNRFGTESYNYQPGKAFSYGTQSSKIEENKESTSGMYHNTTEEGKETMKQSYN